MCALCFPDGLTRIETRCSGFGIRKIVIPVSVEEIAPTAFMDLASLSEVVF